jgi:maltooligosyltrehalose trehalohydrolase
VTGFRVWAPAAALAKTLTGVFFHDGTWSLFRRRTHGRPVPRDTGADRFIGFLQNHDQVGNRAVGDRLGASTPLPLLKVAAGLVLTAPFTPMLFMGEEWGARSPWQYFTDHPDPALGRAVEDGRRSEFAAHGWQPGDIPDPQDRATFEQAGLVRGRRASAARPAELVPRAHRAAAKSARAIRSVDRVQVTYDESGQTMVMLGCPLLIVASLAAEPRRLDVGAADGLVLAASNPGLALAAGNCALPPQSFGVLLI